MSSSATPYGKTRSTSRRDCLSALLAASAGLTVTALAGPARAQRIHYEHIINLAGRQRMLTQRISKEIMLVALRHDVPENIRSITANSGQFGRVLRGLRHGDRELALPPTTEPEILDRLARVEELWPVFEDHVAAVAASSSVTPRQIEVVAETNLPLLRVANEVVTAYEDAARRHAHSMLAIAINLSGAQRMLSQKMSKELYLIGLDNNADANRQSLRQSIERFDNVHSGLVSGDSQLLLLPAPTQAIRDQLATVEGLWGEFRPMVLGAAGGAPVDRRLIADTAGLNVALLTEMNAAVNMYEALQPQQQGFRRPAVDDIGPMAQPG